MGVTISVIVPVLNGGEGFRRCLEALSASTIKPMELWVVDDGSDDHSDRLAQTYGASVLYTGKRGSGPAVARNLAAQKASGDILFFTDADCAVHPDTLEKVVEVFNQTDAPDAMIGCYDLQPGDPGFLSQYKNLFHSYVHMNSSVEASTFWAGCGAIRRSTFLELGGFDELRYKRPSIEDIDLGYRLKLHGGRITLNKSLMVTHLKRWTPLNLLRTDIRDRGIVWTRLLMRFGDFKADLNLQVQDRISVVLIYLLLLSLVIIPFAPWVGLASVLLGASLLILNLDVYRYFAQQRGIWFALRCIFWHWLYYFYNGISFGIGTLLHFWDRILGQYEPLQPFIANKPSD
jgi:glycosyltransferase involved in cell wall biosynthesis